MSKNPSVALVADLTGFKREALKTLLRRYYPLLSALEGNQHERAWRRFSALVVCHIALVKRLIDSGIATRKAVDLASVGQIAIERLLARIPGFSPVLYLGFEANGPMYTSDRTMVACSCIEINIEADVERIRRTFEV